MASWNGVRERESGFGPTTCVRVNTKGDLLAMLSVVPPQSTSQSHSLTGVTQSVSRKNYLLMLLSMMICIGICS
jgi:hypothetical protein